MANDRDCENCKHHREVCTNGKFYRFCESWDCKFEPKEDTISRKAVLDTLERMDKALDEDRTVESYKELLRECYKVLPSVKPKSECEHDHEILKAYSDGASAVLDKVRAEIDEEYDKVHPYDILIAEGLERALDIIDKYIEEGKS